MAGLPQRRRLLVVRAHAKEWGVDPKRVGRGNPNRCLYFDEGDVDPSCLCAKAQPGFPHLRLEAAAHLISRGITVDDDAVRRAMRIAFEEFKIVLEPSGAIALAAALEQRESFAGRTLVLLCCGGSVSIEDLLRLTATTH